MTFGTAVARALRLRCPRCGTGRIFRSWLAVHRTCPDCALGLEPEPGYYLGAIYLNYGLTILLALPAALLALRWYEPKYVTIPAILFCVAFPSWFVRYAKALWLNLDYLRTTSTRSPE
jgi:uncharacterized protein (DUF983 family)